MKKVGLITLNGYENYGNRLQNYALQEVLKTFNFNVETIIVKEQNVSKVSGKFKKIFSLSIKDILNLIKSRTINRHEYKSRIIRLEIFKKFSSQYLKEVIHYLQFTSNDISLCDFSSEYEYFIVGSDQVWNPNFIENENTYFLRFAQSNKRIAYAASFGISELPDRYTENYKVLLKGMKHISVREDDGARIIKDLINTDVPVLVDPTMLLSRERWSNLAVKAINKPQNKYLLTYFLGGTPKKYREHIQNIAKEKNLAIVNLGDVSNKITYRTGPNEFLDYIMDCSMFCTDSFHGVVFSIIFGKPFIVYPREGLISMYSRINTLLNKFNLNNRKVEHIKMDGSAFNIDYSHISHILEKENKKAIDYLKNALDVKDEE